MLSNKSQSFVASFNKSLQAFCCNHSHLFSIVCLLVFVFPSFFVKSRHVKFSRYLLFADAWVVRNGRTREKKNPSQPLFVSHFCVLFTFVLGFWRAIPFFCSTICAATQHNLRLHKNEAIFNTGFKRLVYNNRLLFSFFSEQYTHTVLESVVRLSSR